jgi:hypothetical protein
MLMTVSIAYKPEPADAQAIGERSPLDATAEQKALEFRDEQAGVRAGSLHLLPMAETSIAYDSNIFSSPAPRQEKAVSISEIDLLADNELDSPAFSGSAFARARRVVDAQDQDTAEYGGSGSLTVGGTSDTVTGHVLAQRRFESRDEIETPEIQQVSFYREGDADLSYAHNFSRITAGGEISVRRLDYEAASQRFRDQSFYRADLRTSYALNTDVSLTASGFVIDDEYRYSTPLGVSATTKGALLGTHWVVSDLADVQIAAGYFQRRFDRNVGEITGLTLRTTATLQPTRLTSVRIDVLRQDAPTRIVGAFGKIRTDSSVDIVHAYSRSLNVFARGRYIVDRFDHVDRTDRTFLAETGAAWLFSGNVVFALEYDYATRSSPLESESFARHLISLSIIGRY